MRPLNGVPPVPTAALRVSVPTPVKRVHFLALPSLRVGLTQRRPLRRPAVPRSIRSVTVAASDRRHLNRAPAGVRRLRAATAVASEPTRNFFGAIATPSSVGARVSAVAPGGTGWSAPPPGPPDGAGTGHVPLSTRR